MDEIVEALQLVESLDDDRVLRRLALLVGAIQRTNFYQRGADGAAKPYISFKVASGELADLPAPKPFREIFVWSTARRGRAPALRPGRPRRPALERPARRLPHRGAGPGEGAAGEERGDRAGRLQGRLLSRSSCPRAARPTPCAPRRSRPTRPSSPACWTSPTTSTPRARWSSPQDVVVHDGDDPYLVVAADKGTATFSDIANGVAESYGFWLGDAFASGGSVGYDHKAMGITARGAWEAVKRHFRELGKDIQSEPFTVVGCGDMSGDVFGNGMLLSRQIRLHGRLRPPPHLPRPRSRTRRSATPSASGCSPCRARPGTTTTGRRSPRAAASSPARLKSIPLTPEVRAVLGTEAEALSPAELINADPQGAGRAALPRRHRHLCEGPPRVQHGRRRQGQRRRARQRRGPAGQGGGRGREPGPDPGRPHRVRRRPAAGSTPTPSTTPPASTPPTTR